MDDKEFRSIVSNALKAVMLTIIICLPIFIFYFNKYKLKTDSSITNMLSKKESFVIYVYDKNIDETIVGRLEDIDIEYYKLDIDKEKNLDTILLNIKLTKDDINPWALIYIKDGSMASNINSIDDIDGFLDNLD